VSFQRLSHVIFEFAIRFPHVGVQALLYAVLKVHSIKVAEAVEHACRANQRAEVPVLVAAVVEAYVNAKLERTDVSTALFSAASEPEGAAVVQKLSKRVHRALTAALSYQRQILILRPLPRLRFQ
jgi:hypothetical protein